MSNEGLGDVSELFHNQGVADHSWLSVDMEEYRRMEALPKQNLDCIPELQEALQWDGKDDKVPSIIPLRPHTVVNSNPLDTNPPIRSVASVANRLATYIIIGLSDKDIAVRLQSEFGPEQLLSAAQDANAIIAERGLLGNIYINSAHFPRCAQDGDHRTIVHKFAGQATYVLAKSECIGCVHNNHGICSSFKKRLTADVPYDAKLAAQYSVHLNESSRLSEEDIACFTRHSSSSDIKRHLQVAFQRPIRRAYIENSKSIIQQAQKPVPTISQSDIQSFWDRRMASIDAEAMPSAMYLIAARKMIQGNVDPNSIRASSDSEVRKLAKEYGLIGHTYLDVDAIGGVQQSFKYLQANSDHRFDFLLYRVAATDIDGAARLQMFAPVVSKRPELTIDNLRQACGRALESNRLTLEQTHNILLNVANQQYSDWPNLISQVNLYIPPEVVQPVHVQIAPKLSFHHGDVHDKVRSTFINPEEVRISISKMMNNGLSGSQLQYSILSRYAAVDLAKIPSTIVSQLAMDDGIQGHYFIDPTVYSDYGKGCSVGASQLKRSLPEHILAGSSCTGCVYQTHPSWCSKYAKSMIRQIPDSIRAEANERRKLPVLVNLPVENPVEKYELASEMVVEINPRRTMLDIQLPIKIIDE